MLPAGLRQRDQTKKSPTGPYDRGALMQHLEKVALEHKDREDLVPFTGEKKGEARRLPAPTYGGPEGSRLGGKGAQISVLPAGKAFVAKKPAEIPQHEQVILEPELEEALKNATDAEMCDIAGSDAPFVFPRFQSR